MSATRGVWLVGFMGSGKTAVGELVARRTGRVLVDTDRLVEGLAGRPVREIFAEAGEARFRELERRVLGDLAGRDGVVVATGGGTFLSASNRRRIRAHGVSVWLDVPLSEVVARIGQDPKRPLWRPGDALEFRVLFERRRACYALADLRIDASGASVEQVAGRVADSISSILR